MKVISYGFELENEERISVVSARATGFLYGDNCGLRLEGKVLNLRTVCSPVRLTTGSTYWVALTIPEFADEGHKCAQVDLIHPDWLRAEVAYINLGTPSELPFEMFPVEHRC